MEYTHAKWLNRHRHRSDISIYVTHLTRARDNTPPMDVLIEILNSSKLKGSGSSEGFIIGNKTAVCFQDMPLYGVSQNSLHEQLNKEQLGNKIRYNPIGLCFKKQYVYNMGGRPVFYEKKEVAKKLLPEDEWWRIVSFDISNENNMIDWTHEREWRIKGDFIFDLKEVTVLLTKQEHYPDFINNYGLSNLNGLGGIVILDTVLS
jgi:hypothetical protein